MKMNQRPNPKACDVCDRETKILLTLDNGFQVCPKCKLAKV
jgi:hypothetical protein